MAVDLVEVILSSAPVSVVLGAGVAYVIGRRRAHRERIDERIHDAMSAVAGLQASRHFATGVPAHVLDVDVGDRRAFEKRIRQEGVERFIAKAAECREALARAYPHCPDLRPYWDRFEVPEGDTDAVLGILRGCVERRRWGRREG